MFAFAYTVSQAGSSTSSCSERENNKNVAHILIIMRALTSEDSDLTSFSDETDEGDYGKGDSLTKFIQYLPHNFLKQEETKRTITVRV